VVAVVVVEVVDKGDLLEVEVEVEDCLMNVHSRFGTYHRKASIIKLEGDLLEFLDYNVDG